jgi:hypothetical protein
MASSSSHAKSGINTDMLLAQFEAPNHKISRARKHIDELEVAVANYLALNPVQIVVEQWKAQIPWPTDAWTARIRKPVPPEFGLMIGDAVHNLRTALDLCANDLVRSKGKSTKGVYFPFADSKDGLDEMIKRKNFNRAGPVAVEALKFCAPYRGGNIGLRSLHELDIADKHQALVPVLGTAVFDFSGLVPNADDATKAQLKQWSTTIERDGQEVIIIPNGWGPRQGTVIKADYVLWIRVDPGNAESGGHEVVLYLRELARITENIVGEFERISHL